MFFAIQKANLVGIQILVILLCVRMNAELLLFQRRFVIIVIVIGRLVIIVLLLLYQRRVGGRFGEATEEATGARD